MPLASTTHEALGALEDICFTMTDGEAAVRVEVQRDLLVAIGGRGQNSPILQLTILEEHRAQVERVASDKYDDGNYQRYANGSVVPHHTCRLGAIQTRMTMRYWAHALAEAGYLRARALTVRVRSNEISALA